MYEKYGQSKKGRQNEGGKNGQSPTEKTDFSDSPTMRAKHGGYRSSCAYIIRQKAGIQNFPSEQSLPYPREDTATLSRNIPYVGIFRFTKVVKIRDNSRQVVQISSFPGSHLSLTSQIGRKTDKPAFNHSDRGFASFSDTLRLLRLRNLIRL